MSLRHCSDGERLPQGKWYCGPNCLDLLKDADTFSEPASERLDTSYEVETDPDYGGSVFDRERGTW